MEHLGIDWEGPIPHAGDAYEVVTVPKTECPLTSEEMEELQAVVPPLALSTQYGIDLYEKTLEFVAQEVNVVLSI